MRPHRKTIRIGRWFGIGVAVVAVAGAVLVWVFSNVRLVADGAALARVELQPFAGSLVSVQARGADGRAVPIAISHGRLTPRVQVAAGERISISVVVRRPGWESWALGTTRHQTLTVRSPVATITNRWPTVARGAPVRVRFDTPVDRVSVAGAVATGGTVTLPATTAAGSVAIAAAVRPWESLGAPVRVTWFPQSKRPVVLVSPGPKVHVNPLTPIRLTFSEPVSRLFGGRQPSLVPAAAGRWRAVDDHTLVFRPSGGGLPFNSEVTVRLPLALAIATQTGVRDARVSRSVRASIAPASFMRLQQLLAQEGYLPLAWRPTQAGVEQTMRGQLAAAVDPPAGHFEWRYPGSPQELQALWKTGEPNEITRGAVMMFQDEHHLAVDGIAGPRSGTRLLRDAVAGTQRTAGYSYVYVHRSVPQLLTLWHNGRTVLTSPGNTGVPAAPTALGTWPVFEHIPVGRMSGTNPDGTRYNDPGIRWISYFHGGEALHAFTRASFGTPQSLGCVELPLSAAAEIWPYTPIGTLVTIEN